MSVVAVSHWQQSLRHAKFQSFVKVNPTPQPSRTINKMVAALTLLLCKPDIRDEIIATQLRLGKLGLPASKADREKFQPTPASVVADKQFAKLGDSVRPFANARAQKQPLPKLDWNQLSTAIDKLTSQPTSFFAIKIGDLLSFPRYARGKMLSKELAAQAEAEAKAGNKARCLKLLNSAHALSTNKSWNQEFVGVFSARAAFAIYVASVKRVAALQPSWLKGHPELFRPLGQPDFRSIFRRDYVMMMDLFSLGFPLTKEKLPKDEKDLRAVHQALLNWEILYPKIEKAKTWNDAQKGYKLAEPLMKNIEVGAQPDEDQSNEKFTMTEDFLNSKQNLDAKLAQMNQDLAKIGKS